MDVAATVVATLVSTIVASFVAWNVAEKANKAQREAGLHDLVVKIIDLAIEYPFLEQDSFCEKWPSMDEKSDRAMRYDNYCCLVFNTIERIWKHCKGNENRIEEFLSSKEMINRHKAWWRSEKENNAGYGYAFAEFVNSFLKP